MNVFIYQKEESLTNIFYPSSYVDIPSAVSYVAMWFLVLLSFSSPLDTTSFIPKK